MKVAQTKTAEALAGGQEAVGSSPATWNAKEAQNRKIPGFFLCFSDFLSMNASFESDTE